MPDSRKDPAVTDVDVYDISSSSYSPLALRSLRQPIPNDLPPHLDARVFTFQDAFEDLLAVSQGRTLPDIQARYDQSRILRQMYPNGEPAFLWLRRLESQGLASRPRGFRIFAPPTSDWDAFEKVVEKGVKDFWDGIAKDIKENPSTRDALEKASKVFKQLDEKYTDDKSRSSQQDPASQNKPETRPPADTFDDLYSSIKSSFTETQKAWDTFKKVMAEDVPARAKELERDVKKRAEEFSNDISRRAEEMGRDQEARRRRDIKVNDKQTETREEYVDLFGYKHTTVRRKTYDDDGNEIGSSVEVTVRPAEKKEGEGDGGGAQNNELGNKSASGNGTTNKRGWLWKKGD